MEDAEISLNSIDSRGMISAWEAKDVRLFASIMELSLLFLEHFIVSLGRRNDVR